MARCGGVNRGCRHVNWLMYYGQPAAGPALGYELLYNWFAATDVRGIAPDGWRVPDEADFNALIAEVSPNATYDELKSVRTIVDGDPYWGSGLEGTDTSGLALYGAGIRSNTGGEYTDFRSAGVYSSTTESASNMIALRVNFFSYAVTATSKVGASIRCLRDTEPSELEIADASGNLYTWVQIGTQYWLAKNLKTTKYNNGDSIATGLDDAAWAATTDGAWAYPNGDQNLPI